MQEPEDPQMPSLFSRIKKFVPALLNHISDGMKKCTKEEIEARLAICEACPLFKNSYCTKCGCSVSAGQKKFLNKVAWKSEVCPLGKWEVISK
jgi:hypothetical protein